MALIVNLKDILAETVTVFYRIDTKDRTDGIKTDKWVSVVMAAQWRDSVSAVTGNGVLSHTTTHKIHLTADDFQPYESLTSGWTVRPGDYVAKGTRTEATLTTIKAIPGVCLVQAVKPCLNSGMQNGEGALAWLNSVYVEGA